MYDTEFRYRGIRFRVRCDNDANGEIAGATVLARYRGREVESSTKVYSVYFFANDNLPKLRNWARRYAYELIRSAR